MRSISFGSKFTTVIDGVTKVTLLTVSTTYEIDYDIEQIVVTGVDPEFRRVDKFTLYGAFEYDGIDEFLNSVDINAPAETSQNFQNLVVATKTKLDSVFSFVHNHTNYETLELIDQDLSENSSPVFDGSNFHSLPSINELLDVDISAGLENDLLAISPTGSVTTIKNPVKTSLSTDNYNLLADEANWTTEYYTGSESLTDTYKGMNLRIGDYFYYAVGDGDWIRLKIDVGPTLDTGNLLHRSNRSGTDYGHEAVAQSAATYTISSTPAKNGGFAVIRHKTATPPTFSSPIIDLGVSANYQPNKNNLIVVWAFNKTQNLYYANWNGSI